jgi:hypothetical protein
MRMRRAVSSILLVAIHIDFTEDRFPISGFNELECPFKDLGRL